MEKAKTPVHVIKFGRIHASIWRNETKYGPRFNVTVSRVYQDNGEWKRSESFGRDELLAAALALQDSFRWVLSNSMTKEADEPEE